MRDYETMFILKPDLEEEAVNAAVTKFQDLVTGGGGTVSNVDRWGKRRLAYEIAGYTEGIYVVMEFSAEPGVARELERVFRITDEVIRHLIVRKGD
ncbi:MAG TPA: 30S ribosomal protein S6 [Firmicutes bacterium]|nr:30S ribosomal protein S6 [Bacillota bacterium]